MYNNVKDDDIIKQFEIEIKNRRSFNKGHWRSSTDIGPRGSPAAPGSKLCEND